MFFIIGMALRCLRRGNAHQQSYDLETGRVQGDCFVTQGHVESQMNKSFLLARQASPRRKFSDAKLAGLKTKLFILLRLNMAMLDKGLL